jgi:hypothetical protein
LAILALPDHLPSDDYPDLMARCRHGDAVLDRLAVLEWTRKGRAQKVQVSLPRRTYAPLMMTGGTVHKGKEVRRWGDKAVPLEELRQWLGRDTDA